MTTDGSPLTGHGRERHEDSDVPVKVAYESFVRFDHWLDDELAKLVACWAHAAAPSARRAGRARDRGAGHR
ncbi:MAG: hypothetical protein GXY83_27595 [Rhodopirellula sp.]|nr:hypothetical protein [Rhodopirellula sp.]